MTTSNRRAPRVCSPSRANATTAVITPPTSSGRSKSNRSAMAPPSTSARSVAMATSSACTHRPRVTGRREVVPAQLRQALPGGDAGLGREVLDEHGHQVADHQHPDQQIAEARSGRDVGGEVAGIDVGDGRHEGRAEQGQRARRRWRRRRPAIWRLSIVSAGDRRQRRRWPPPASRARPAPPWTRFRTSAKTCCCRGSIRWLTMPLNAYAIAPVCRTVRSSTSGCRAEVIATPLAAPSASWVTPTENRSRGFTAGSA